MRGLLAGPERKNGWTLAEHAGAVSPDGMQRLLRTADWDVDGVRDDVRGYVLDGLGDSPQAPSQAPRKTSKGSFIELTWGGDVCCLRLGSNLSRSRVARRPLERVVGHLLPAWLDTGEV